MPQPGAFDDYPGDRLANPEQKNLIHSVCSLRFFQSLFEMSGYAGHRLPDSQPLCSGH